jgi:hypothetical protein
MTLKNACDTLLDAGNETIAQDDRRQGKGYSHPARYGEKLAETG